MDIIITDILAELKKATAKHSWEGHNLIVMDAIINEEKGEVTRAVLQHAFEEKPRSEIKKELIQTAAMCIRMLLYGEFYNDVNQLQLEL